MTQLSAIQLLRDNHKTIRGLFRQFEGVNRKTPDMREGVIRELFMMLDVHFRLEEELLQPLIDEADDYESKAAADDCGRDHNGIRSMILALRRRGVYDEHFDIGLNNLITTCEEHFEREQNALYPSVESALGERLSNLAQSVESRRKELMSAPRYRDSRPEVVQNPNGGEQMRKSSARQAG